MYTAILTSLLLLLLCQYYYLFRFFLPLYFFLRKKIIPGKPFEGKVSVLIAAHNELQNLKNLIPALYTQEHSNFEIILVLDRCTDGSGKWIQQQDIPNLQVIYIEKTPDHTHPKKHAINLGIETASGEVILLTDADCVPVSTHWITRMTAAFNSPGIQIVIGYGAYQKAPGLLNAVVQYETLHTAAQYLSLARQNKGYMAVGRNWAYRKKHFQETGFGETGAVTGGDDDLLFQKLASPGNYVVCARDDSFTESIPPTSWKQWFRQKTRHLSVGKKYKYSRHWDILMYTGSWLIFFPLLLITCWWDYKVAFIFFMARTLVFAVIFNLIAARLKSKLYWIISILLDIFYNICYFILALSVLLSKKIQWK